MVLPLHTEFGELREHLVLLPGMSEGVLSAGDIVPPCDRLVIDLTIDWFRPLVNPPFVLTLFADLYSYFSLPNVEKVVFRSYRCETSQTNLQHTQAVFFEILRVMKMLFGVKEVVFPTIVSRKGLTSLKHPLLQCLLAMRSGSVERIGWSASSEVYVAYEIDVLQWLSDFVQKPFLGDTTLVGERVTLGDVVKRLEVIFSSSALTFDKHAELHAVLEGSCQQYVFDYSLENIGMELLY